MRNLSALLSLLLVVPIFMADTRHIEVDEKTDFTAFKTFAIHEGRATSRKAEINNKLILKNIEEAIRSSLLSKGLKEAQDRPDLTVAFSLAEEGERGVVGRGIRNAHVISRSEGTLVIEMTSRDASGLVWQGIYTDDESNASKLASKLPDDAKKLISQYPPKRK